MHLGKLKLVNFLSFESAEMDLKERGLVAVTGLNKDSAAFSTNGVGKSAIIDAVFYVLYGKTIRGLEAGDIIRRDSKKCEVSLEIYDDDGKVYLAKRTRTPSKSELELTGGSNAIFVGDDKSPSLPARNDISAFNIVDSQAKINQIIGMDSSTFEAVVIFGDDVARFARASDREQKAILDKILDMGTYEKAQTIAKNYLEVLNDELAAAQSDTKILESQKEQLLSNAEELLERSEKLKEAQQDAKDRQAGDIAKLTGEILNKQIELEDLEFKSKEEIANKEKEVKELEIRVAAEIVIKEIELKALEDPQGCRIHDTALRTDRRVTEPTRYIYDTEPEKRLASILSQEKVLLGNKSLAEQELANLTKLERSMESQKCRECGQSVNQAEFDRQKAKLIEKQTYWQQKLAEAVVESSNEKLKEELAETIKANKIALRENQAVIDKFNRDKQVQLDLLKSKQLEMSKARQTQLDLIRSKQREIDIAKQLHTDFINQKRLAISRFKEVIVGLEARLKAFKETVIDDTGWKALEASAASNAAKCEDLDVKIATQAEIINKRSEEIKKYEFWKIGFGQGGIKSFLLDSVAEFLNSRANHYAATLCDGSMEIIFSTQTELKTGEKREKFSVQAINQYGSDIYKGNSGGEKQRIDICVALALNDLARTRASKAVGIVFMDEIFERVDSAGCERVVRLLRENKELWPTALVISHNSDLTSLFQSSVTIVKENGKSSIA